MSGSSGRVNNIRLYVNPEPSEGAVSENKQSSAIQQKTFIEILTDHFREMGTLKLPKGPGLHRVARRRVFENIVSYSLNHPKNPYSQLIPNALRQEMIGAITDQLVQSHYFRS